MKLIDYLKYDRLTAESFMIIDIKNIINYSPETFLNKNELNI